MTTGDNALPQAFLELAADVFGVGAETLSPDTSCGSIPEWDSVMHLRLAMEAEARYGVRLPFERLPEMRSLRDFLSALEGGSPC